MHFLFFSFSFFLSSFFFLFTSFFNLFFSLSFFFLVHEQYFKRLIRQGMMDRIGMVEIEEAPS